LLLTAATKTERVIPMTVTAQVNVRMPLELLAWLQRLAEQEHRTLSGQIKALLEDARSAK
jgi:hypothetical protein